MILSSIPVLHIQWGSRASWFVQSLSCCWVIGTGKISLEKPPFSWGSCFCAKQGISGASSMWVAVNAQFAYSSLKGFAVKHKLILNHVWYLSSCPEHPDPRDGSTPHLGWISKFIGSCQLSCVCVRRVKSILACKHHLRIPPKRVQPKYGTCCTNIIPLQWPEWICLSLH